MAGEISEVFVVVEAQIANGVVDFGGTVDGRVVSVREVYQVDAVLLGIDRSRLGAFFAVVDNDLIVFRTGNEMFAVGREVDGVDFVGILAEDFGHLEAPNDAVYEFHLHSVFAGINCRAGNRLIVGSEYCNFVLKSTRFVRAVVFLVFVFSGVHQQIITKQMKEVKSV